MLKLKKKGCDLMMTADKSLFFWNQNDEWWDYDKDGKIFLTDKAPEEARKSYEAFKKK